MKFAVPTLMFLSFLVTEPANSAWEQNGRFLLGYQSFYKDPTPLAQNTQKSASKAEIEPSLQWSNKNSRIKFKAIFGYDSSFSETKDRNILIPEEFFWETRREKNNYLIGVNTYNWGVTDVINPLDVLNTRSYRNILNAQKIGSPSLSWTHARDFWSFDLVYIPVQLRPQLQGDGSRFFPQGDTLREFAQTSDPSSPQLVLPPEGVRYRIMSAEDYEDPFKNNLGLKLRFNTERSETQVIGFEGHPGLPNYDPRPNTETIQLAPTIIVQQRPDFDILPQYQRVRMGGLGWVYTLDSFIVKFAHAQVFQTKANVNLTHTTYTPLVVSQPKTTVLAIEKPFSLSSLENTLVLQYATQSDPNQDNESKISTRRIYDGSFMIGLRTASSLDWSTTIGFLANTKEGAQILSYDLQYRWNDHTQLQLNGQHLQGKPGTLMDSLSYASNANLNLISTW